MRMESTFAIPDGTFGTSIVEIDFDCVDHNIVLLRRLIDRPGPGRGAGLCCVVKADAYGLGVVPLARRLQRLGVEMLAVYTPGQARQLVLEGIMTPILVLMPLRHLDRSDPLGEALAAGRLHCVCHDAQHLNELIRMTRRLDCVAKLHVEIDTGMSRGGMGPAEAEKVLRLIQADRAVFLAGLFTHFACADERAHDAKPAAGPEDRQGGNHASKTSVTDRQFGQFLRLVDRLRELIPESCLLHAASTYAALTERRYDLDMLRVGLAWIGCGDERAMEPGTARSTTPHDEDGHQRQARLQPILMWRSSLVHVKWIESGTPVGYGHTWRARRRTRVGLVPVGYADGYPSALSNGGGIVRVSAGGDVWTDAPVIGQVSMDQITIDLTDIDPAVIDVGADVELIGRDRECSNHPVRMAQRAGISPYELLCGISPRIRRIYTEAPTPTKVESELGSVSLGSYGASSIRTSAGST